jgi:rhomboid family GlyGly-CTERM serine protease
MAYRRPELAEGEWWRALTGHWTHWSVEHLAWDMLVFAAVGALLEARGRRSGLLACAVAAAIAIASGVWLLEPGIGEYRGLSGIATALFTLLAVDMLREALRTSRRGLAALLAAALAGSFAKLALETISGTALFVDTEAAGFVALSLAHLLGAIVGGAFGLGLSRHPGPAPASALARCVT